MSLQEKYKIIDQHLEARGFSKADFKDVVRYRLDAQGLALTYEIRTDKFHPAQQMYDAIKRALAAGAESAGIKSMQAGGVF